MIMTAKALLDENPKPTEEQLKIDERLRERSRANAAKAVASPRHISKQQGRK